METNINKIENNGKFIGQQNTEISGGNTALNGDINQIYNYNSYSEVNPSFAALDFDSEVAAPSPVFTNTVVKQLVQKRVLIIKGNNHFDLLSFGRSVAEELRERNESLKAFELIQNEENQSVIPQLKKEKSERILVLNGIHPRHIEYNFNGLIQTCEERKSYYIIGIESGIETWEKAGGIVHDFWFEIPPSNHYDHVELTGWFAEKMKVRHIPFLTDEDENITPELLLSDSVTMASVVRKLGTPQKLVLFLNLCQEQVNRFSDKKIGAILHKLSLSQEEIIIKWFNALLPDQKIIALTAALFNGLFCHQYFEILTQMITTSFWKQSENTLEALDYYKMDFLDAFFRFETTEEGDLLVARNPLTRISLLKTASHQYPRHIEKALEVFSENMRNSYRRDRDNWNLYGTTQKRALIRQVFIETTRDIGINALFNIERVYLELAASNHKHIQGIAAKSFAQYRFFDKDELLFETISNWLQSDKIEERVALFLDKKDQKKLKTVSAIKVTTLRILAYAADYDRPNQLHPGIVDYFVDFANEANHDVQDAVADVIPKFIHHHAMQLQNRIFDVLMPNDFYRIAINKGLKLAYDNYPNDLKTVINHWLSICIRDTSKDNRRVKATNRDNTLMTIVTTLSGVNLNNEVGFSLDEIHGIAIELLKIEKRKVVQETILKLIAKVQCQNYDFAFEKIETTLGLLSRKSQKELVQLWFGCFLEERSQLTGGEFYFEACRREFPAWRKLSGRPLTAMEEALFRWLNSKSKIAQRFATLTFLEIAKEFDWQEYKAIRAYHQKLEERKTNQLRMELMKQNQLNSEKQEQNATVGLGIILQLKIFFYLLFEDRLTKQGLKDIIKIFLSDSYSRTDLKFVIFKWRTRDKGTFSNKLAKWLGRFKSNF